MNLKLPRPLRIAVLECDTPLPNTKKIFQGYGGVFERLLRSGAKALDKADLDPETSLEFSFWQVELNPDKYPDPENVDAILITGSSEYFLIAVCQGRASNLALEKRTDLCGKRPLLTSKAISEHDSFADTPWINKLVNFTEKILSKTKVRVIGVCFGHQIVGRALKARVGRNPDGWEAAVNDVQLSEKGKELFGIEKLVRCAIAVRLYSDRARINN